jgi:hypothetical protein
MNRIAKLQLIGPVALFLTVLAAEAAVFALSHNPTSELLWYINLKIFGIFQRSHYVISDLIAIPGAQLLFVALPILALAVYGLARSRAFALAIGSNLSFIYAGFLLVSWDPVNHNIFSREASLATSTIPSGTNLYTLMILIGTSLLSFVISHLLYVYAIRGKA